MGGVPLGVAEMTYGACLIRAGAFFYVIKRVYGRFMKINVFPRDE